MTHRPDDPDDDLTAGVDESDPYLVDVDGDGRPDWVIPADDDMALTTQEAAARPHDAEVAHRSGDLILGHVDAPAPRQGLSARLVSTAQVQRRILPAPLTSLRHLGDVVWAAVSIAARNVAWVTLRAPYFAVLLTGLGFVGFGRAVALLWCWCWDLDNLPARREARMGGQQGLAKLSTLETQRREIVQQRWINVGVVAAIAVLSTVIALAAFGLPGRIVVGTVAVAGWGVLGVLGKPQRLHLLPDRVIVRGGWSRLTSESVRRALVRIGAIKDPADVTFPREITREGPGQLAIVELPDGDEAVDVVVKRGAVASAFRIPLDQVFLSEATGPGTHPGMLELFVMDKPASAMTREEWPRWPLLASTAKTSVFDPHPFAHDERFRPISTKLFELNFLIGGQPGSGKSAFLRTLLGMAGLDATCELQVAELKGVGDFVDVAELCSVYICGVNKPQIAQVHAMLVNLLREVDARGERVLRAYQSRLLKETKVSPEVAAMPGSGLHPIAAIIDEAHEAFTDDTYGKECKKLADAVGKRGRALGVILLIATQIPDSKSLPPNLVRLVTARICCAVKDPVANNMIMGAGSYAAGYRATSLRPEIDAAWGLFSAVHAPRLVHAYYPLPQDWRRMVERMRHLRGGRVVGGQREVQVDVEVRDLLTDVEEVLQALGLTRIQWGHLRDELASRWPAYEAWEPTGVSAAVRGLTGAQHLSVRGPDGAPGKGVALEVVQAAIARRALPPGDEADEDGPDAERLATAVQLVLIAQYASARMLARKLRVDAEAAEAVLEQLEDLGVVGPAQDDTDRREVLAPAEDTDEVLARIGAPGSRATAVPRDVPRATHGTADDTGTVDVWRR